MKKLIHLLLITIFLPLISLSQPTGYTGVRLNGTNMTNQTFVYNSPGITPTNSRLLIEQKDSTYYRLLYKAFRVDYLGSASSVYLKTDASGNFQIAPITDIFNPTNYYNKTDSDARYLQSFTEQDPIYTADSSLYARKTYVYSKVQSDGRYLQSFTESDPIFTASVAFGITSGQVGNWNTAFSWGNHAGLYPLLSGSYSNPSWINTLAWTKITGAPAFLTTETDPIYSASTWFSTINNSTNWNTAYGWGNHAGLYPLLAGSYSNPSWINSLAHSKITYTGTTGQYVRGDGSIAIFPTIPAAQVNSDWNALSGVAQILNKPNIYSFTGSSSQYTKGDGTYATFPTNVSSFTNDVGYLTGITSSQITIALGYTPYNGTTNPLGFLTGITSGQVTTALGYTPVPNSRTLTINGNTQDLTVNRTFNVGTVTNVTSTDNTTATIANGTTTPAITIVSAPKLQTARNINGTSFDGTSNITIPGSAITGIPNTSLTNSSITINGNSVALGASTTVTASPSISAPTSGTAITMGTAFQPRPGGPCWIAVNASLTGALGLNETIIVSMSSTSGGTYTTVTTDVLLIGILGLTLDRTVSSIPVPSGWWIKVTRSGTAATATYTKWDF